MTETSSTQPLPRRAILGGAAAAGITVAGAAILTGCGTDPATGSAQPTGGATTGGTVLATRTDIPVGGGTIFSSQQVVVTQPVSGQFKAFSVVCTHQGCAVSRVSDGQIICPCHNSRFSVADGSVQAGPATQPLASVAIAVNGNSLSLG